MEHLIVSPNPHRLSGMTTQKVMGNVLIALAPAVIASAVLFGGRALVLTAVCVICCMLFEYLSRLVMGRASTLSDLSAAVTGVLLAMCLPVTLPFWMAAVGCFVSIVIVKQLFGGLGQNFANPAVTGRIVLMVSFVGEMTRWVTPFYYRADPVDLTTSATPLASAGTENAASYLDLFLGNTGGCLGEISALALLLGGLYLMGRGFIHYSTPAAFIGTVFVLSFLGGMDPVYQILSGGLFLGAFFMATDYVTTPLTVKGKWMFGVGCGVITFLIRRFGNYPEGVSFAILLMNILTPYLDRASRTHPLGTLLPSRNKDGIKKEANGNG